MPDNDKPIAGTPKAINKNALGEKVVTLPVTNKKKPRVDKVIEEIRKLNWEPEEIKEAVIASIQEGHELFLMASFYAEAYNLQTAKVKELEATQAVSKAEIEHLQGLIKEATEIIVMANETTAELKTKLADAEKKYKRAVMAWCNKHEHCMQCPIYACCIDNIKDQDKYFGDDSKFNDDGSLI